MYDFKQLSPADFEDLTRDLLQQHWHVLLEAFKTGRDQGIDLRYSLVPEQAIIIQCKHFAGSTIARLIRELRAKELPKVKLLNPTRYVLVTSLPLSPADKDKIRAALHPYIITTQDVLGSEDMNNLLNHYPVIETQHFKLWMSSTAVLRRVLQISEAARSLLLALYSLGGEAQLDQLEEVWKDLHERRSRKYNWKRSAEDWRRSLQDLEGGFLVFQQRRAKFVNPSVKDFLDTTLVSDTEHLDDLLCASCRFEQVVNIWSLAQSEKGAALRTQVRQAPEGFVEAISHNLQQPHEQRIEFGRGAYGTRPRDAKPEVRLLTIISVADHTESVAALKIAKEYSGILREYWRTSVPEFDAAAAILRSLDAAHWRRLAALNLHQHLKEQLLDEIADRPRSSDISTLVDYAVGKVSRWSDEDKRKLAMSFDAYLKREFSTELSDDDIEGLQGLLARLGNIGDYCGVDVSFYLAQVDERISGLRSDDEDSNPVPRQWEGGDRPISEQEQEAEVQRLFDGLSYS